MREIKDDNYGPVAKELIGRAKLELRPRTLVFGTPDAAALAQLQSMDDQNISLKRRVRMPHDAQALRAGLWLLFDFMKESHDISQSLATPSGSFWHAILHRREPDPENAKYWFNRVGEHPIKKELLEDAREIAAAAGPGGAAFNAQLTQQADWDGAWFVDCCTRAGDPQSSAVLLDIQRREWALLFDHNFKKAFA